MESYPDYIELYTSDRKAFNKYLKAFHKQTPDLDLFQCEMILRTPLSRIDSILKGYSDGSISDSTESANKTFEIISATISHPGDSEEYPITASFTPE
jgi:hypothetical protein